MPAFYLLVILSLHTENPVHRIAAIPGDGIGIEVVEAALKVLNAAAELSGSYKAEVTTLP